MGLSTTTVENNYISKGTVYLYSVYYTIRRSRVLGSKGFQRLATNPQFLALYTFSLLVALFCGVALYTLRR